MLLRSLMAAAALAGATFQPPSQPAQSQAPPTQQAAAASSAAPLAPELKGVHLAISTRRAEAQQFFDQGLALLYAANFEEAIRTFQRASDIDPGSPMPYWGMALALAPTSRDADRARDARAYAAVQRAVELAVRAPAKERAYVNALAKRFSNDANANSQALAVDYKDAMRQLTRTYPNDMHAATLFAESMMNLHPRGLWSVEGTPAEGTTELVEVLEQVLAREPDHLGANHYYIHATEASLTPERALKSARKLEALSPGAGHLLHIPSHTYMRTGDYSAAAAANARAVEVDRKYLTDTKTEDSVYASTYYNHNLDFLASAAMMAGHYTQAVNAASELSARVAARLSAAPELEHYAAEPWLVGVRFAKWNEVLALPAPPPTAVAWTALHHFSRGVAQAALGATADAEREREAYLGARQRVPATVRFRANPATQIFAIADKVLEARIAAAKGDAAAAVNAWHEAVTAEDALEYSQPADWFYPARESLGGALLRQRKWEDADLVFREDLERNPNNGRSLWGRWQAMRGADGDVPATLMIRRRFQDAWSESDVTLRLDDY